MTSHHKNTLLTRFRPLRFDQLEDRRMLAWGLGELDPSFGSGGVVQISPFGATDKNEQVTDFVQLSSGKLLALVSDDAIGSSFLARYGTDGVLDTTFGGGTGFVNVSGGPIVPDKLVLQGENVILYQSGSIQFLARYSVDGVWDSTFGPSEEDFNANIYPNYFPGYAQLPFDVVSGKSYTFVTGHVVVTADSIVAVGTTLDSSHEFGQIGVAKFTANGAADSSFAGDGIKIATIGSGGRNDWVYGAAVDDDDNILVGGAEFSPAHDVFIARFEGSGEFDDDFGTSGVFFLDLPGEKEVSQLIVKEDVLTVIGRENTSDYWSTLPPLTVPSVVFAAQISLVDGATSLNPAYGTQGVTIIDMGIPYDPRIYTPELEAALDPFGRLLIAESVGTVSKLVRLTTAGNLDPSFGTAGYAALPFASYINYPIPVIQSEPNIAIHIESDGDVMVAAGILTSPTNTDAAIARIVGRPDVDGDGIANPVDLAPTVFSSAASDGTTTATITTPGNQTVSIVDAENPAEGLLITAAAGGGAVPAAITVDGTTLYLDAGESVTVTHGSVIVNVIVGVVEVVFAAEGGPTVATSSLSAGSELKFEPETVTFTSATTNDETPIVVVLIGDSGQVVATASLASSDGLTYEPETTTFTAAPSNEQPVEVILVGANGQEATATLSADTEITFEPQSFTFSAPATNSEPVQVIVNGEPISVTPGNTLQPVQIDIRPGDSNNTLNLTSNGVIAVAILSTATFDARNVLASSVIFAGAFASHHALQDVNGDGRLDMVLHFRTQDTNLRDQYEQLLIDDMDADGVLDSTRQTASVSLSGETVDEVLIEGFDDLDLFLAGKKLRDLLDELFVGG